jgi:DNA (cytosine-5)-methyltransferase 1
MPSKHIPDWRHFPTQPPVRWRDYGISDRLAGITFPRWRNESIKAFGNAIVPQVMYEIFKAINVISNNLNK